LKNLGFFQPWFGQCSDMTAHLPEQSAYKNTFLTISAR